MRNNKAKTKVIAQTQLADIMRAHVRSFSYEVLEVCARLGIKESGWEKVAKRVNAERGLYDVQADTYGLCGVTQEAFMLLPSALRARIRCLDALAEILCDQPDDTRDVTLFGVVDFLAEMDGHLVALRNNINDAAGMGAGR